MQPNEIKALVSLLEDDELADDIQDKILTLGTPVIPYLEREWETHPNPKLQLRIEELIHTLQYKLTEERLMAWCDSREQNLWEGLWIISTYQYPDLSYERICAAMDDVYEQVRSSFTDDPNPYARIKSINQVFFDVLKFRANNKNFHSPFNSYLHLVLESKQGNPISLCLLYLWVTQKLNLPVYGVNLPNLFLLTYRDEQHQFYINVFNKGLIFTKQDIENYIQELHLAPRPSFFDPCDSLSVIQRVLRNLVIAYDKNGEHAKSEEVKKLLFKLSPGDELV